MADRLDYYFRQRVTEAELDLAFELLERADRNLAADIGVFGVVHGAAVVPHVPVADFTVDLAAPTVAYDRLGQRIFFGSDQRVDCAVDEAGLPTTVTTAGRERWLGVFLRFDRLLSDPRTDGNSQQVYFHRDEAFQLVVRQAAEAVIGTALKVPLPPDELLLCDVLRRFGQTQISAADLDASRRQAFVFATGDAVEIVSGVWSTITPALNTVQSALDAVDALLTEHFSGTAHKHAAAQVMSTAHGFLAATNVQAAIDELVDDLTATTAGTPGASYVGADAVVGAPNALAAGTVDGQLAALLTWLNAHLSAPVNAHAASAVGALPHATVSSTSVQGQLQEIIADLAATAVGSAGASTVGIDPIAGAPNALGAGSVRAGLAALLGFLNAHVVAVGDAHPASAINIDDAANLLASGQAEKAFAEILTAWSAEHFRANEPSPGQHRAIHQPSLGGVRALLWDSAGNGGAGAHFRVYADSAAIWFTVNAAANAGGAWVRDDITLTCGGFRFSRDEFAIVHDATLSATFATWSRTWRLPTSSTVNSAFELQGAMQEVGRVALAFTNSDANTRTLESAGAVTFRSRFAGPPSSVTFTPLSVAGTWSGTLSMNSLDRDGFAYFSAQTLAGLATTWWFGTYTAIA